jgi:hypothetical protein
LTGLPGAQQCTCFSQSFALAISSFINVKTAALRRRFCLCSEKPRKMYRELRRDMNGKKDGIGEQRGIQEWQFAL